MKVFWVLLVLAGLNVHGAVLPRQIPDITAFTKELLTAGDANEARGLLGITLGGTNDVTFNTDQIGNDAGGNKVIKEGAPLTNSVFRGGNTRIQAAGWTVPLALETVLNLETIVQGRGGSAGGSDATAAINDAIAYRAAQGGGVVRLGPGTWKVEKEIVLLDGVYLAGAGIGVTTIDASSGTRTNAAIFAEGSIDALPTISGDIAKGDRTVVFASAHGLAVGDVFIIEDTDDYSWNTARTYYRAGEFLRVAEVVDTTTVTVMTGTHDAYEDGADKSLWKVNPATVGISGMTMLFEQGVTISGIKISMGTQLSLSDLDLSGSRHAQIYLDRCYDVNLSRIRATDYQAAVGNNYGITLGNCQRVNASQLFLETTRHGWATGGGDLDGAIPCREITIADSTISGGGVSQGLDIHGNAEWVSIENCILPTGAVVSGDHIRISGCTIYNHNDSAYAITLKGEDVGFDFEFIGNTIEARTNFVGSVVSLLAREHVSRPGGLCVFRGNKVKLGSFGHPSYPTNATMGLRFGVAGDLPATDDFGFVIEGNEFTSDVTTDGPLYHINQIGLTGGGFRRLTIRNNELYNGGIRTLQDVAEADIQGNQIFDPPQNGIKMLALAAVPTQSPQVWRFERNYVTGAAQTGINVFGDTNWTWYFTGNIAVDNARTPTGTASVDGSFRFDGGGTVFLDGNTFGDTSETPNQMRTYTMTTVTNLFTGRNVNIGRNVNNLTNATTGITHALGWPGHAELVEDFGSAPRTSTTWTNYVGERRWNSAPSGGSSSMPGWSVIGAGAPGNWTVMAPISSATYLSWDYTNRTVGIGTSALGYQYPLVIQRDTNAAVQLRVRNIFDGTNASAVVWMEAGSTNRAGVSVGAWNSNYSDGTLADRAGAVASSESSGLVFAATTSGQTINFYAGDTTLRAWVNSSGLNVADAAYDAGTWDGSTLVPTRNAVRDALEAKQDASTAATDAELAAGLADKLDKAGLPMMWFAVTDETTALTAGAGQRKLRAPRAFTITGVRASLSTGSSSGAVTVDINEGGVSIFSTTLTIDSGETTSTSAAVAAAVSDASIADDAEISVDIDGEGTGAAGLKVIIYGTPN